MHDVIIVGGSYAGLSAALQVARARRRVLIVDAGERRNRAASSAHGFLGWDGRHPATILAAGKADLLPYETVTWVAGKVMMAEPSGDGFVVQLDTRERHEGRRLILATGVVDVLPESSLGVAERWGRCIFHCPYCHGYELGGGRIAAVATSPMSAHLAAMLPDWGEVTYFTRGQFEPTEEERALLERRGVTIDQTPVMGIGGEPGAAVVLLVDGRTPTFAGVFLPPMSPAASPLVEQLGCAVEKAPHGVVYVRVDATQETTVPGVFAAGDMATPAGAIAQAVSAGALAGVAAHQSLIFRRFRRAGPGFDSAP